MGLTLSILLMTAILCGYYLLALMIFTQQGPGVTTSVGLAFAVVVRWGGVRHRPRVQGVASALTAVSSGLKHFAASAGWVVAAATFLVLDLVGHRRNERPTDS